MKIRNLFFITILGLALPSFVYASAANDQQIETTDKAGSSTASFFYWLKIAVLVLMVAALVYALIFEWPLLAKPSLMWLLTPIYPVFLFLVMMDMLYYFEFWRLIFWPYNGLQTGIWIAQNFNVKRKFRLDDVYIEELSLNNWRLYLGAFIGAFLGYLIEIKFDVSFPAIAKISAMAAVFCVVAIAGQMFQLWLNKRVNLPANKFRVLTPYLAGFLFVSTLIWLVHGFYFYRNPTIMLGRDLSSYHPHKLL